MPRKFIFVDQKNQLRYTAWLEREPLCPNCPQEEFPGVSGQRFQEKADFTRLCLEIFCSRCGRQLVEIPLEKAGAKDGLSGKGY